MISTADRNAWASFFAKQGIQVLFANGQLGMVHTNIDKPILLMQERSVGQTLAP